MILVHRTRNFFNSNPNRTLPGSTSNRDSTPWLRGLQWDGKYIPLRVPCPVEETYLPEGVSSLTPPALGVPCLEGWGWGAEVFPQGSSYPGLQPWLLPEPSEPPLTGSWRGHLPSAGLWKGLHREDPSGTPATLPFPFPQTEWGALPSGVCHKCDQSRHEAPPLVTSKHRGRFSICPRWALPRKALSPGRCGEGFGDGV